MHAQPPEEFVIAPMVRHRRLCVLRGPAADTLAQARARIRSFPAQDVLWIGEHPPIEHRLQPSFLNLSLVEPRFAAPRQVKRLLGQAFSAVVLDLHGGFDPDLLAQAHGFIRGGGVLVLRLPPVLEVPTALDRQLTVWPFAGADVEHHLWSRLLLALDRLPPELEDDGISRNAEFADNELPDNESADNKVSWPPVSISKIVTGTAEQSQVVRELCAGWSQTSGTLAVLTADRGRGKSSALGLALAAAKKKRPEFRAIVSAPSSSAAAEVLRFANDAEAFRFVTPHHLLVASPEQNEEAQDRPDVIVIDEAAQLPVPLLQRLLAVHPHAHFGFASTVRGYEGTGRGFLLRFVEQLEARARSGEGRQLTRLRLEEPIRWSSDDPLEAFVFDLLALNATPAVLSPAPTTSSFGAKPAPASAPLHREAKFISGQDLAKNEKCLREVFGLLVHAHYRTTPSDLRRLLDAPNLDTHVLFEHGQVVAACLVAREGGLPTAECLALNRGERRIRGHALADLLLCHSHQPRAGELKMVRSVRIATHPERRRQGLAGELAQHVHQFYQPDLFGTVFGATPALLRFRQALGYEVVRLGTSQGARTGEPSVMMLRALSDSGQALVGRLRADLARDLPLQQGLQRAEGGFSSEPELWLALASNLAQQQALSKNQIRHQCESYAFGPRPFESALYGVIHFVRSHLTAIDDLSLDFQTIVRGRVLDQRAWTALALERSCTVPTCMRLLRRAMRALLEVTKTEAAE